MVSPEDIETLEVMADRRLLLDLVAAKADIRTGRYKTFKLTSGIRVVPAAIVLVTASN